MKYVYTSPTSLREEATSKMLDNSIECAPGARSTFSRTCNWIDEFVWPDSAVFTGFPLMSKDDAFLQLSVSLYEWVR